MSTVMFFIALLLKTIGVCGIGAFFYVMYEKIVHIEKMLSDAQKED